MKKLLLFILPLVFTILSCNNAGEPQENQNPNPDKLVEIEIAVDGMTCSGCENTVNAELLKLNGVTEAKASHVDKKVVITVDTTINSVKEMEENISKVGYTVIHP